MTSNHTYVSINLINDHVVLEHRLINGLYLNMNGFSGLFLLFWLCLRHSVGTYEENKVACNFSGNTCSKSSRLTGLLWTGPGLIGVHQLISM